MAKFNSSTIALATIIAFGAIGQAALAESYVTNRDIISKTTTRSNLNLRETSWTHGGVLYGSYAHKDYKDGSMRTVSEGGGLDFSNVTGTFDGDVVGTVLDFTVDETTNTELDFGTEPLNASIENGTFAFDEGSIVASEPTTTLVSYNGFTHNTAGSFELGYEAYGSNTAIAGTINSLNETRVVEHETAAGTRASR